MHPSAVQIGVIFEKRVVRTASKKESATLFEILVAHSSKVQEIGCVQIPLGSKNLTTL